MLGLKKKQDNFDIFASKVCLNKYLDATWSCNLKTPKKEKIPVVQLGGMPRLKLEYEESEQTWLCGVVALDKGGWKVIDINKYKTLNFCYYEESGIGGKVSFVDKNETQSNEVDLTQVTGVSPAEECQISLELNQFFNESFEPHNARLFKIIGVNRPHFYISNIFLS